MPLHLRRFAIVVGTTICIAAYLFPYVSMLGAWWRWLPSTIVILIVGGAFHGASTAGFFGLKMSLKAAVAIVALFFVLLPVFSYVLFDVLNEPPLHVQSHGHTLKQLGQFFQVLNDEILVRAAMLTILLGRFAHPKTVGVLLAGFFAVGHHFLYAFYGSHIDWEAMVTLFSFGTIANLLFVRVGHIGYSLALHYAWNFHRFNSSYSFGGYHVAQGDTFNLIEGSTIVSTSVFITALCVLLALTRWGRL